MLANVSVEKPRALLKCGIFGRHYSEMLTATSFVEINRSAEQKVVRARVITDFPTLDSSLKFSAADLHDIVDDIVYADSSDSTEIRMQCAKFIQIMMDFYADGQFEAAHYATTVFAEMFESDGFERQFLAFETLQCIYARIMGMEDAELKLQAQQDAYAKMNLFLEWIHQLQSRSELWSAAIECVKYMSTVPGGKYCCEFLNALAVQRLLQHVDMESSLQASLVDTIFERMYVQIDITNYLTKPCI